MLDDEQRGGDSHGHQAPKLVLLHGSGAENSPAGLTKRTLSIVRRAGGIEVSILLHLVTAGTLGTAVPRTLKREPTTSTCMDRAQ